MNDWNSCSRCRRQKRCTSSLPPFSSPPFGCALSPPSLFPCCRSRTPLLLPLPSFGACAIAPRPSAVVPFPSSPSPHPLKRAPLRSLHRLPSSLLLSSRSPVPLIPTTATRQIDKSGDADREMAGGEPASQLASEGGRRRGAMEKMRRGNWREVEVEVVASSGLRCGPGVARILFHAFPPRLHHRTIHASSSYHYDTGRSYGRYGPPLTPLLPPFRSYLRLASPNRY